MPDVPGALRWPEGVRCPRCQSEKISRIVKRDQFDCDACRYQFSVTAGTIFHDSHLPLWKWFLAVYVMGESKKGITANQLKRMLEVELQNCLVSVPPHPCRDGGRLPRPADRDRRG